jgi:hypothetical protein
MWSSGSCGPASLTARGAVGSCAPGVRCGAGCASGQGTAAPSGGGVGVRGRCRACRATHVLQPVTTLGRRLDLAEVIGQALQAHAAGRGQRRIAIELGRPRATVVGWLRRFADPAEPLRVHFTRLAHELDPELAPVQPHGQPAADALEAIGVAARAAARCVGPAPPWWVAAGASGGWLLGVLAPTGPGGRNTSASLPAPG